MRVCWKNFTGGELAPSVQSRYDLEKYNFGVAKMENLIPGLHGDVQRRPGTRYVGELEGKSVLIPFCFSTEEGQNFVLIFSAGKMRVASEDEIFAVSVASPYAEEDLYDISYAQSGDVVYLAHKKYPLHKVMRTGSAEDGYSWSIEEVQLNTGLPAPGRPTVTFSSGSGYTLRYKVTAVDENGNDSLPSQAGEVNGKHPSDWTQGNHATITWNAIAGAKEYNIYREEAGYYGFIGVVQAENATGGSFVGLTAGDENLRNMLLSGSIVRNRAVGGDGSYDYRLDMYRNNYDNTSNLVVSANAGQNAFYLASLNRLFVRVTKTTNVRTWRYVDNSYNDGDGHLIENRYWTYSDTSSSEVFWVAVDGSGAGTYTSYSTSANAGTDARFPADKSTFGVLQLVQRWSAGTTLSFIDNNFEADTSDTPKEDWNPFLNGNHPATVCFHQQRMVLAGTKTEPSVFYMSKTGQYEGFRKSRPLQDDDPVEFMIASGSIDQIVWAVSFGDLLLGTSGAEYKVTADGDAAITPKTVGISTQSFWGSAKLAPLIIGNSVLHSQRFGGRVRDLYYSLEKDGYQGNDLSIMAPHLFDGHTLLQWCYQQTPGSCVWCVRDDGVLLCLTYLKEHNIYGWSRHITSGKFVSVCTINGASADVVMCVVGRTINGQRKYFLERMADKFYDSPDVHDAFFVDCGKTVTLQTPGTVVGGLEHLDGAKVDVLADGSPIVSLTVADGSITLPYAASVVQVGLPFISTLGMLPMEADIQTGSTLGKQRGYGKAVVRFMSSVGGKYGAEKGELFDIPFLPTNWGEACVPYTGDIELIVPGGQASDSSLVLVQDRPLPFHITAVAIDVDFGEV